MAYLDALIEFSFKCKIVGYNYFETVFHKLIESRVYIKNTADFHIEF